MEPLPIEKVCELARTIPCAPSVLPLVLDVLNKEESNVQDVQEVIEKDPGLAGSILRMANSAYFSGGRPCDTLDAAVVRLGRKEIYRITASSIAGKWLVQEVSGYGWEPGDLCKHSLCVGVAAELICSQRQNINPELAYTAGLLHDVGKLGLAYACSDHFNEIFEYQNEHQCSWRHAEKEMLGYDHCVVGGELLKSWSFPENLVQIASYYAQPDLAEPEHLELALVVHAAKHLALILGFGVGEEGFTTELNQELLTEHHFDAEELQLLLPDLLEKSEKLIEASEELP
ncbi:MAG: HDOD domain-containing protein [Verrucomicrobiota bacterium]